jgi:hypothetical protein
MELYYAPKSIYPRMNLEEALKLYSGEIQTITLQNGKKIEIIAENQQFRSKPENVYVDNQLQNEEENNDEFVEENIQENFDEFDHHQIIPKKIGQLRGKNKGLGKSLRKTILKSIDGSEQEKQFKNGRLRNIKAEKSIFGVNDIIQFSDNNEFMQCANCHKFFPSDENEENKTKTEKEEKKSTNIQKDKSQQLQPNINSKFPYPQQIPINPHQFQQQHQKKNIPHSKIMPQQGPIFPNQNLPYPHHHLKPLVQQHYPNMNMGFPHNQTQYQEFPPFNQINTQMKQNNYQQKIFNNQGQNKIPGKFPYPNQYLQNQFRGNQAFRARKKEIEEYEMDVDDYYNNNNLNSKFDIEENYYYPASAKKCQSGKKMFGGNPIQKDINYNFKNSGLQRNLSFGFKKNISNSNREFGYTDNNLTEFMDINDNEYYEYPQYNQIKMSPFGKGKKIKNHKMVNVKVTRNIPYHESDDYQDYYQDYQNYEDYQDFIDYDN